MENPAMTEQPVEQPEVVAGEESPKPSRSGMLSLVKAVAFVSIVVVVEIVAASMLAPTAQETERLARQFVAATEGRSADPDHAESVGGGQHAHEDIREVELGIYNVTRYNPKTNTTMAIDFELYGIVPADDAAEFKHLYESNHARIREQIIMTLHSAQSSDLTNAGLGLIKRRILEKTNRAMGQPLLEEVLFSKFNFVER